ncbi:flagellar protein FlaG [Colwellia sp. 6M3]|jgi:flagellar protein FlaG|uniref:flagellar protein FlaG n=1 Tax=Colwellia sp. 6M3 TaxID=2759849 RepID=UPI0015F5B560|nr:flagellar protein FlaG [Colwellia sp. 6M3]MBA6414942.1 flagellar protein FlaG [Colwellia sp. 6M3]|tara:strand:- start:2692 stop:3120 length:429 start_codon:yes stop_codon:yes gene_type:complete
MNVSNTVNTSVNSNNSTNVELVNDKAERKNIKKPDTEEVEKNTLAKDISVLEEKKTDRISEAKKAEAMTPEQLDKVAQQLQEFMGEMNRSLEFLVDKDSGRDVIKVLDKGTGDLIKQYPSEEVLAIISKLSNATGSLIDTEI